MDGYDFGWQEFVTICVSNGEIVTVEYNAAAETGFIKSTDVSFATFTPISIASLETLIISAVYFEKSELFPKN